MRSRRDSLPRLVARDQVGNDRLHRKGPLKIVDARAERQTIDTPSSRARCTSPGQALAMKSVGSPHFASKSRGRGGGDHVLRRSCPARAASTRRCFMVASIVVLGLEIRARVARGPEPGDDARLALLRPSSVCGRVDQAADPAVGAVVDDGIGAGRHDIRARRARSRSGRTRRCRRPCAPAGGSRSRSARRRSRGVAGRVERLVRPRLLRQRLVHAVLPLRVHVGGRARAACSRAR